MLSVSQRVSGWLFATLLIISVSGHRYTAVFHRLLCSIPCLPTMASNLHDWSRLCVGQRNIQKIGCFSVRFGEIWAIVLAPAQCNKGERLVSGGPETAVISSQQIG